MGYPYPPHYPRHLQFHAGPKDSRQPPGAPHSTERRHEDKDFTFVPLSEEDVLLIRNRPGLSDDWVEVLPRKEAPHAHPC